MEGVVIFMMLCATIYGIFYMNTTARHKERMELLDRDIDPKFVLGNNPKRKSTKNRLSIYLLFFLKIGMIFIGVGVGVLIGSYLHSVVGMDEKIAMSSSITISIGLSLVIFYLFGKKTEKNFEE